MVYMKNIIFDYHNQLLDVYQALLYSRSVGLLIRRSGVRNPAGPPFWMLALTRFALSFCSEIILSGIFTLVLHLAYKERVGTKAGKSTRYNYFSLSLPNVNHSKFIKNSLIDTTIYKQLMYNDSVK